MIITIDGPSGTGKTSVAKKVAQRLGITFFDTGAMYRAVAWAVLRDSIDPKNEAAMEQLMEHFTFHIQIHEGEKRYFVGNTDVTNEIRTQRVTAIVSEVSALSLVREKMWQLQRAYVKTQSAVFEGRDMGSVVFPEAEVKIFLTASPEIRAERRLKELEPKEAAGYDRQKMKEELARRDAYDSSREIAPLKCPKDATVIDTSSLTLEEVVDEILKVYEKKHKDYIRQFMPPCLKAKNMKLFYRFILCLATLFFKVLYRHKVYGIEHYFSSAAIIAPNHTSYLDPPIASISWPEEVHFLARESLFKNPFFGALIRALNSHPVSGDASDVSVFKTILKILSEGKKIILFPEGQRTDGQIGTIKPGIGLLLMRSKSAIIPTYIQGAYEIWGRDRKWPRLKGRTICVFGSPISWEDFADMDRKEAQEAIAQRLSEALQALKKWLEAGAQGIPP